MRTNVAEHELVTVGRSLCDTGAPIMPPAPPIFSMITCCCSASLNPACKIRATASIGPPAANGTTMVTGRVGQVSA